MDLFSNFQPCLKNLEQSFCFCNMYSDEMNFLCDALHDLLTCHHFADGLKHFKVRI